MVVICGVCEEEKDGPRKCPDCATILCGTQCFTAHAGPFSMCGPKRCRDEDAFGEPAKRRKPTCLISSEYARGYNEGIVEGRGGSIEGAELGRAEGYAAGRARGRSSDVLRPEKIPLPTPILADQEDLYGDEADAAEGYTQGVEDAEEADYDRAYAAAFHAMYREGLIAAPRDPPLPAPRDGPNLKRA